MNPLGNPPGTSLASAANIVPGSRWRLKSNLSHMIYEVVGIANVAHSHPHHPQDVVYRGDNGHLWTNPVEWFVEKMEPFSPWPLMGKWSRDDVETTMRILWTIRGTFVGEYDDAIQGVRQLMRTHGVTESENETIMRSTSLC